MNPERGRSALGHARHVPRNELNCKGSAASLVSDAESGRLQRVAILTGFSNEAGIFGQGPGDGKAEGTMGGTHDVEDGEESPGLEDAVHLAEEGGLSAMFMPT